MVTHYIQSREADPINNDKTVVLVGHCGERFELLDNSPAAIRENMTWQPDEVTCEACVAKGFDRGQKQSRTMRLNKAKKEAENQAAYAAKQLAEKVAAAQKRYAHLRRVKVLPVSYEDRRLAEASLSPVEVDIMETVQSAVYDLRRETADIAGKIKGIATKATEILQYVPAVDRDMWNTVPMDKAGRMLHETTWIGDTREIHQKAEEIQKRSRLVASMAWAAGYIVPDLMGAQALVEWTRAQELLPEEDASKTVAGAPGYFDFRKAGTPEEFHATATIDELWLGIGQLLEDARKES